MIQPFLVFGDWGLFALRIAVGLVLIAHGAPKLRDLRGTAAWMEQIFKPGMFWAVVVSVLEVVGGAFLIVGFLVQPIAVLLVVEFAVILLTVKRGKPLVGGYELDLLILAATLALAGLGGGALGADRLFRILLY